jgi:hypothetical protein
VVKQRRRQKFDLIDQMGRGSVFERASKKDQSFIWGSTRHPAEETIFYVLPRKEILLVICSQ